MTKRFYQHETEISDDPESPTGKAVTTKTTRAACEHGEDRFYCEQCKAEDKAEAHEQFRDVVAALFEVDLNPGEENQERMLEAMSEAFIRARKVAAVTYDTAEMIVASAVAARLILRSPEEVDASPSFGIQAWSIHSAAGRWLYLFYLVARMGDTEEMMLDMLHEEFCNDHKRGGMQRFYSRWAGTITKKRYPLLEEGE